MLLSLRSHREKTFQHWGCKMAYYPDVNPGEPFKPIATLENELRHMVNARDGFRGSASAVNMPQNFTIRVCNTGSEVLPAGIPVSISGGFVKFSEVQAVTVHSYSKTNRNWGILTAPLGSYEFGDCIVAGAVIVDYPGEDYPQTLVPSENGFISGGNFGEIKCLYSGDGKALILLGSGSSSGEYNNYFKVAPFETDGERIKKIEVIDGSTYNRLTLNELAGYTDLGPVYRKELDIPRNISICRVYIKMQSYGSYYGGTIELFTEDYPPEKEPYILLAEIYDNCSKIAQRWLGGKIYWRDRFFYPFDRDGN